MIPSLNIEFHTMIVSFALTALVSGVVFVYFKHRVSVVEQMCVEQVQILKMYIQRNDEEQSRLEYMMHNMASNDECTDEQLVVEDMEANSCNGTYDGLIDISVSGDKSGINLEIVNNNSDSDEVDTDEGSREYDSDDESLVTDADTASDTELDQSVHAGVIVDEIIDTTNNSMLINEPIQIDMTPVDDMIDANSIGVNSIGVNSIGVNSTEIENLMEMDKSALCNHITSNNISQRPMSSLMKLKKDALIGMCSK